MQYSPNIIQQLQWQAIRPVEESILTSISRAVLSPSVRLWHACYEPKYFSTHPTLIQKTLHDAGLETAPTKRQAEFWAGRCLMMRAFRQNTPLGKLASGAPAFPKGKNGALSHSCRDVLLLEGSDNLLFGVDIEPLLIPISLQAVLSKVATETEQKWLRNLPPEHLVHAATILFSAKETLFKLLNREMDIRPDYDAAEAIEAPNAGSIVFRLTQRAGRRLAVGKRYLVMHDKIGENKVTWVIHPPEYAFFMSN